jgi:hypothetical protein
MFEAIQPIFHAVVIQIASAGALIAVALCGLAWLRLNGK